MKWDGPDSIRSWLISLACCFINSMMFGMARLSGVLFVASISRFKVDRKQASLPYTLASCLRNLSGPLVGYLGHKFGVRAVTAFGALLGAIGASACFFAESITVVTFLWGVVFGFGFGFGNCLLPISINQYFDKHRATASGISFSGGCLGSFILPPIVETVLNNYDLSQTFLLLSGFILNCVPAALLLKKPNFRVQRERPNEKIQTEKQAAISETKETLCSPENYRNQSELLENEKCLISIIPVEKEKPNQSFTSLTYEERLKRLSTQTLLSGYSVHMSSSGPLDVDLIMDNNKERNQIDLKILQTENFSLSSNITDHDGSSEKDEVFDKDSLAVQYPENATNFNCLPDLSSNLCLSSKKNDKLEIIQNESYQKDISDVPVHSEIKDKIYQLDSSNAPCQEDVFNTTCLSDLASNLIFYNEKTDKSEGTQIEAYENHSYEKDTADVFQNNELINDIYVRDCSKYSLTEHKDIKKILEQKYVESLLYSNGLAKNSLDKLEHSNEPKYPNINSQMVADKNVHHSGTEKESRLGSFSIIFNPVFLLIAITNAIYTSSFVCMVTVIVDFSRDLHIETSYEKYILMLLSVGDIIGRLGLGWITDRGYMTTPAFAAMCFACQGLFTGAIVWSNDFISLAVCVILYGLAQAGLIVIFPVILAQFIEHDKQTVAYPSSLFLSGPFCLAVAPLIGYVRDELGAYDWLFYGIAVLSAACSLSWIFAACIVKCKSKS